MGAFHAYDIRGVYNVDFDRDTSYKIGNFLPELMKCDRILVGRDARISSPEIHDALVAGITDAGADVYDMGLATTPMVYYATAVYDFDCSVQITASHNPKEYNGMKVSARNALPVGYENGLSTIEQWIKEGKPLRAAGSRGKVLPLDVKEKYLSFLSGYKADLSGLNIAMDLSNGMAALLVKDIFGKEPHYICDELDGTFPNHEANPLVAENIIGLQNLVVKEKCDIGVIYDGDADRVMFVDENAVFISPDLMIALLGHYFLKGNTEKTIVLQDIRSSKSVKEYLEPMGADVRTWKVGRAFAARRLRELDGLFGGELAGHYYFKDFFYSDSGILASILILNVVADFKRKGVTVSELISGIKKYENSGEINFRIGKKKEAMDLVRSYFVSLEKPVAEYDFDGYRVEFDNWWFNIRPSNTEPYLRFIAEASDSGILKEKIDKVRELLSSLE